MKTLLAALVMLCVSAGAVVSAEQYLIREGDTLDIAVAGEPNISKRTVVRPDGKVAVAMVGDVKAAGLTPEQLRANLQKSLAKYIKRPNVSIEVTGYDTAASVNVLGGVRQPGQYPLRGSTTLMDAIALAGGTTPRAKLAEIVVIRHTTDGVQRLTVDLGKTIKTGQTKDSLVLREGDSVYVPEGRERPDWLRIIGTAASLGYLLTR